MVHGQCAVPTHDTPGRWRLWSTAVRMSSTVRTAAAPPAALLLTGLLLTALLLAAAWTPAGAAADVINPELAAKLATLGPDELVRVIIYMEEQPLVTAAMGPDTVKFLLKDAAARSQRPVLDFLAQGQERGDVAVYNSFWIVNAAFAEIRAGAVERLAALPGVKTIREDYTFSIDQTSRGEMRAAQTPVWDHYATTFVYDVWEKGYTGQGVTIAIADTGLDITHPELAGALGGSGPYHTGYWAEFDAAGFPVSGSMPHDTSNHGTWVASIAAGRSAGEHTVGMAPGATLAGVIVIPGGTGTWPQVIGGLQWVAERGFDVVNGSFGANTTDDELAVVTDNLAAAGVVPVFANGNWNPLQPNLYPPGVPGNTPAAIAVGGFDLDGESAWYNFGGIIEYPGYDYPDEFSKMKPDLSAPGMELFGALAGGGYYIDGGTSGASPHVAGAVALMLEANPFLTVDDVKHALYTSVGGHEELFGWPDFETKDLDLGWGRLNALRAVEAVALPEAGFVRVTGTVVARSSLGDEPIAGAVVTFDGPEHASFETDAAGSFFAEIAEGFYTVTASATGFMPETREMTLIDQGHVIEIHFALQAAPQGSAVGRVTDADTGAGLAGVTVTAHTGQATTTGGDGTFSLPLPEGAYTLTFARDGYFAEQRDIHVFPGQASQVDVAMAFGDRTLRGTVTDDDGAALAGVTVRAAGTGIEVATSADGAYALDLPPGEYSLEFAKLGYVTTAFTAAVERGQVTTLDVTLPRDAGRLAGHVTDTDGQPVAGAVVSIPELDLSTATDDDGYYELDDVPAGTWRVTASHGDFWAQSATVHVARNETTTQNFRLQPVKRFTLYRTGFDTADEQDGWSFINYRGTLAEWHFTGEDYVSPPYSAWNGDPATGRMPTNQAVGLISPVLALPAGANPDLRFTFRGEIDGPWHAFAVFVYDYDTGDERLVFLHDTGDRVEWTDVTVPLGAYAGHTIHVEFYVETDFVVGATDVGIFVDDVEIGWTDPEQLGTVAGVVTDADGRPMAGVTVSVAELTPDGAVTKTAATVTGDDGRYELTVAPGGWTLRAAKLPDYLIFEEMVYVEPGGAVEKDVELAFNEPPAAVAGLTAEPGDGFVRLSWQPGADADLAGYNVYRSLDGASFHRIGFTEAPSFTAEGLQNGYSYVFAVRAVDALGKESDEARVEAVPMPTAPAVEQFDVQPRVLTRGGSVLVTAVLNHPLGAETLDVRLEAARGDTVVRRWDFPAQAPGAFEAAVETVDDFGRPLAPDVYGMTLFVSDADGATGRSNTVNVALLSPVPQALSFLLGNNPFNPAQESQRIEFTLPSAGRVTVSVFTLDGRKVATLVDGYREAGRHVTFWDGTDDAGRVVLSGMYVVRAEFTDADGQRTTLTRHSVVVK